jgi:hypothetical protein
LVEISCDGLWKGRGEAWSAHRQGAVMKALQGVVGKRLIYRDPNVTAAE